MKKFLTLVFGLLFLVFLAVPVQAVIKTTGDLRVTFDEPVFADTIVWYPGLETVGQVKVENIGLNSKTVQMATSNTSQTGDIDLQYSVKINANGVLAYGSKTMRQFWDDGEIEFGSINAGGTKTFDFYISLPSSLGNEYQGTQAKFDLKVGFKGYDSVTVTSTDSTTTASVLGSANVGVVTAGGEGLEVLGEATDSGKVVSVLGEATPEEVVLTGCRSCLRWPALVLFASSILGSILLGRKFGWARNVVIVSIVSSAILSYLLVVVINQSCGHGLFFFPKSCW